MDGEEATQPSTQYPGASIEDAELFRGVLCLLIPESEQAKNVVRSLYKHNIYRVLACTLNNDEPFKMTSESQTFNTVEDKAQAQGIELEHLAIALREEPGKKPEFKFGRNYRTCDVWLGSSVKLSNTHFTISLSEKSGALVLRDTSMNGTTVDGLKLIGKNPRENMVPTRTLQNGSKIELFDEASPKEYISFNVRVLTNATSVHEASTFGNPNIFGGKVLRKDLKYFGLDAQYQAIEFVGQGSFAVVWKAVRRSTGDVVAIKQIKKRGHNSVNREAIQKEVTIMERLKHPNIVEYYECIEDSDSMNICLEFVEFGDLRDFTSKHKLSELQVQDVTKQMLEAVEYLHSQGVTHRDLKPENILVTCADPLTVKITDFGLAKLITSDQSFLKTFCGTMLYLAPEAFPAHMIPAPFVPQELVGSKRKRPVTDDPNDRKRAKQNVYGQSVDIWAIGCIVYMLMTGKHPFEVGDRDEILSRIQTAKFDVEILRQNSKYPAECTDFLSRLIKLNPALRISETEALRHPWLRAVTGEVDMLTEITELSQGLRIPSDGPPEPFDEDGYVSDEMRNGSELTAVPQQPFDSDMDDQFSDGEVLDNLESFDFDSFERVDPQSQSPKPAVQDQANAKLLVNFNGSSELFPARLHQLSTEQPSTGSGGSIFVTPDSNPSARSVVVVTNSQFRSQKSDTQMKSAVPSAESSAIGSQSRVKKESVSDEDDSGKSNGMFLSTGERLGQSGLPSMPGMPPDVSSEDSAEVVENSSNESEIKALKKWADERPSQQTPEFVRPPVAWGKLTPLPGSEEGSVYHCTGNGVLFGRSDKCEIQFSDIRFSRRHAAIVLTDPTVQVQPKPPVLNNNLICYVTSRSSNHVYLNGEPLPRDIPCRIFNGDSLVLLESPDGFVGYSVELKIGDHERPEGAANIVRCMSRSATPTLTRGNSAGVSLATTMNN